MTQSVLKHSVSILKQVCPAAMLPNWKNCVVRPQCCASNWNRLRNHTVAPARRAMSISVVLPVRAPIQADHTLGVFGEQREVSA